jgi:heme/copper-type cytochrome/quinol oxidase subunit 2
MFLCAGLASGSGTTPNTLAPASTATHQIVDLSIFVISITSGIFVLVGGLLAGSAGRRQHAGICQEPQPFGDNGAGAIP